MARMRRRSWLAAGLWALCLGSWADSSLPPPQPARSDLSRVVFLNDFDPTLPAFIVVDRAFKSSLAEPGRRKVDLFHESLDMLRFNNGQLEKELVALLAKKYENIQVDVVVVLSTTGLAFADRHRAALWPHAFIVFSGVNPDYLRENGPRPYWSGFSRDYDVVGTANIALRLRPSTRRIVVITGSSEFDETMNHLARSELAPLAEKLRIEYWERPRLDELLARVRGLDRDDAVIYLSIGRDADGLTFTPREVLKRISAASPAPVYGPFETFLGYGAAAGSMYSFEETGKRLADLTHQVLSSPSSATVHMATPGRSLCMAQAEEMDRRGLDRARLPGGCIVNFSEPSLWRQYRWHVVGATAVILAQSALIFALVRQRRARTRAEQEAQRRRVELAQAGRLALAGELTASIAHEINQPLGSILANAGAAEAILRRSPNADAELQPILADIRSADLRASAIIQRVRALVTSRQTEREEVDPGTLVREVLALLRGDAQRRGVTFDSDIAGDLPAIWADRVQVEQALVSLCINAMEAMAE